MDTLVCKCGCGETSEYCHAVVHRPPRYDYIHTETAQIQRYVQFLPGPRNEKAKPTYKSKLLAE